MTSDTSQNEKKAVRRPWKVDADYQAALLVEYEATQDKLIHSDQITWQRATIQIAAVVASLAIVATNLVNISFQILAAVSVWFTGIIVLWYLWDRRLQSEGYLKYKRLHEIERMLGVRQHLMIDEADRNHERKRPCGRTLAKWLVIWIIVGWGLLVIGKLALQLFG